MNVTSKPLTLGMIVGNRGFFPSHLCDTGRKTMLKVLEGIKDQPITGLEVSRAKQQIRKSIDLASTETSALAVAWPDGTCVVVEGRVDGTLVFPPRGDRGFGYDPMFYCPAFQCTFGEASTAQKLEVSHRGEATRKMLRFLKDRATAGPEPQS
mgnify:CR=1 FL=1